jgi:hypothetical protein
VESQTMDPTATVLELAQRFEGEIPGLQVQKMV